MLHISVNKVGSSKLLMNQIDEFILWSSERWSWYTESLRESGSPKRKSLRWSARKAQPYYPIPLVYSSFVWKPMSSHSLSLWRQPRQQRFVRFATVAPRVFTRVTPAWWQICLGQGGQCDWNCM